MMRMYLPPAFREDRPEIQHELIRSHPLATLITAGPAGLMANLLPVLVYPDEGPFGTLRAHLARANAQWKELAAVRECLVVFQGPQHYISPSWYATKKETGKVVPTWNFAMVQARGAPRVIEDAAWLRRQLEVLTRSQEGGRPEPWQVDDAPAAFIEAQMRAIVGLEIPIARIEGKWKMSQNRPEADRRGVVEGLHAQADERSAEVAALVAQGATMPPAVAGRPA